VSEAELPEWEKRIREALKPVTPEHEKRIMEALKPTAVEYEERIREAEKQVDEVKRISRELKEEYGVEQKPAKAKDNPREEVTVSREDLEDVARELWELHLDIRDYESDVTDAVTKAFREIDTRLRSLVDRLTEIGGITLKYPPSSSSPSESNPQERKAKKTAEDPAEVEEEEYEEVRRRARLAKGEKLLPV